MQLDSGQTLFQVQNASKIFSDDEFNRAITLQTERKTPIGQLLVSQGAIGVDVLESSLSEYMEGGFAQAKAKVELVQAVKPESKTNESAHEESTDSPEINEAALESLKELIDGGTVEASALDEFEVAKPAEENESPPQVDDTAESPDVSGAALESLQELIDGGTVDAFALDEFKSSTELDAKQTSVSERESIDLDSLLEPLDDGFLDDYIEETKVPKIMGLVGALKQWPDLVDDEDGLAKKIDDVFNGVHQIKGACSLVNARIMAKLLSALETSILETQAIKKNKLITDGL